MFNLGYKQVVINDGALVTTVGGTHINVEGYGTFLIGSSTEKFENVYVAPVLGTTTLTAPAGWTTGDIVTIRLQFRGTKVISDIWAHGENIQFQTFAGGPNAGTFFGELADGIGAAGFAPSALSFAAGTFSFGTGYEGLTIKRITAQKYDPAVDDRLSLAEDVTNVIVEGEEGEGTPRQVEASIRRATDYSQEPYRIEVGGNESVDFEAEYTAISWFTKEDHEGTAANAATWEQSDMQGDGVNTVSNVEARRYVVYIDNKAAVNATAVTLLKSI